MMTTPIDAIDIITVIAITAFAGGTSFVAAIISKKIKFSEQQILSLTASGAGILISAVIFEMAIEAEKRLVSQLPVLITSSLSSPDSLPISRLVVPEFDVHYV